MTAVCLGGPPSRPISADGGSSSPKVCSFRRSSNHACYALRLRTDGCASCASAVFAIATALIAPRSSHRTRPVPLSSLRAHPSALIALCVTAYTYRLCTPYVSVCCASASACLARSHNLSSFLNSNDRFLYRFHPIWSAGGSGLRSVIVIWQQQCLRCVRCPYHPQL